MKTMNVWWSVVVPKHACSGLLLVFLIRASIHVHVTGSVINCKE